MSKRESQIISKFPTSPILIFLPGNIVPYVLATQMWSIYLLEALVSPGIILKMQIIWFLSKTSVTRTRNLTLQLILMHAKFGKYSCM